MKRFIRILLLSMAFTIVAPAVQQSEVKAQCAMCKLNAENGVRSKTRKVGLGLNDAILFLLAMPYAAVVTVGFLWYRNSKYQKKKRLSFEE